MMSLRLTRSRGFLILLTCLFVVVGTVLWLMSHHLRYVGQQATLSATEQARLRSMPPKYPTTIGGWTTEGIFGVYQLERRGGSFAPDACWLNPQTGDIWTFRYDIHHQPVAISSDGRFMLQLPTYPDHPSFVEGFFERMKEHDPDSPPFRRAEIRIIQRPDTIVAVLPVTTRPDPTGWNISWRGKDLNGNAVFLDMPRSVAMKHRSEWLVFRW